MPLAAQKWMIQSGMVLLALIIYYFIAASSPDRYSIFKVLKGEPAPMSQITVERPQVDGPRLKPGDVPSLATLNREYKRIINHVLPSLVTVETEGKEQQQVGVKVIPDQNAPSGFQTLPDYQLVEVSDVGSGVFISADGHIITNNHIVLGATRIFVTTSERQRFRAEVIGAEMQTDVAILRLMETKGKSFPVLNFSDSDVAAVGDIVLALGSPFGLSGSVTQGVISGTNRRFEGVGSSSFFQTDAEIYPGNSGGPLVNIYGEIIGINVLVYSGRSGRATSPGVSLALPSNQAIATYEFIMSRGRRARSFLGVLFNPLTEAKIAELGTENGVLISQVLPDSPAAKAGLKKDDVVLSVAGENVKMVDNILSRIRDWDARVPMPLAIWRDHQIIPIEAWLGELSDVNLLGVLPNPLGSISSTEDLKGMLGIELHQLSSWEIRDIGLPPDFGGIAVESVQEDSPLNGYFLSFDIIHTINGKAIWTREDFYEALAKVSTTQPTAIVLTRGDRRYYLELRPN